MCSSDTLQIFLKVVHVCVTLSFRLINVQLRLCIVFLESFRNINVSTGYCFDRVLLSQAEAGELSEPDIAAGIAELVLTDNGARGFRYLPNV